MALWIRPGIGMYMMVVHRAADGMRVHFREDLRVGVQRGGQGEHLIRVPIGEIQSRDGGPGQVMPADD